MDVLSILSLCSGFRDRAQPRSDQGLVRDLSAEADVHEQLRIGNSSHP